jgi:hypothetical protein
LSIFTKIFIVLVMVVSVLLVGLIVAFVTNVDTYKQRWSTERAQAETFRLQAKLAQADHLAAVQAGAAERDRLQGEIEALRTEVNQKNQSLLLRQGEIAALQTENAGFKTDLAKLAGGAQKDAEIIATLNDELTRRREDSARKEAENIDLSRQLRERITEVATLERYGRLLTEQVEDLKRQNEELAQRADTAAGVAAADRGRPSPPSLTPGIVPDHPIRGMVTDVAQIGDGLFVTMNVGSNDGVRNGMQFTVHRGEQFLGNAIVKVTDLNSSAALVTLQRGSIRPNEAEVLAGGQP